MKFTIGCCIAALAFSFAPSPSAYATELPDGGVPCSGPGVTPNPYGKPIGQSANNFDADDPACPTHDYYGY